MSAFYSILYCTIRPSVDERISIGLYLTDGDKVFFEYSKEKLKAVKNLLPDSAFKLLQSTLRNLNSLAYKDPDDAPLVNGLSLLNEPLVGFLSTHANNLLTFSSPSKIDIQVNFEMFTLLYRKYIYKEEGSTLVAAVQVPDIFHEVIMSLQPKIRTNVNWDIKLTSDNIPNLIAPTKVLFIGKNEVEVTGDAFDFTKGFTPLKNEIYEYLLLVRALKDEEKNSSNFLIGDEPDKNKLRNQHDIWHNLRQLQFLTYVPTNETEMISEYMHQHNVHPFIEEDIMPY